MCAMYWRIFRCFIMINNVFLLFITKDSVSKMASIQVLIQSAYVLLRWLTVNMAYHKWTILNTNSKMII